MHQDEEFVFLVTDGSAKLSGRDDEFQEPFLRRKSTVKRENLNGESNDDRGEFQSEETKDDERIEKDFWAHAEARKDLSSSYGTEKFNCTCLEKNHHNLQDLSWNEILPRRNTWSGRRIGEKQKHPRQKFIQLRILQGKDGILYSIANLRANSIL